MVRKIFEIFYGLESLNDATGSDSLELSDKMWLIYLYFGRVFSVSIYERVALLKCITQFFSQAIIAVFTVTALNFSQWLSATCQV